MGFASQRTLVLVDQIRAIDPNRLGRSVGRLDAREMSALDEALALVLGLESGRLLPRTEAGLHPVQLM